MTEKQLIEKVARQIADVYEEGYPHRLRWSTAGASYKDGFRKIAAWHLEEQKNILAHQSLTLHHRKYVTENPFAGCQHCKPVKKAKAAKRKAKR